MRTAGLRNCSRPIVCSEFKSSFQPKRWLWQRPRYCSAQTRGLHLDLRLGGHFCSATPATAQCLTCGSNVGNLLRCNDCARSSISCLHSGGSKSLECRCNHLACQARRRQEGTAGGTRCACWRSSGLVGIPGLHAARHLCKLLCWGCRSARQPMRAVRQGPYQFGVDALAWATGATAPHRLLVTEQALKAAGSTDRTPQSPLTIGSNSNEGPFYDHVPTRALRAGPTEKICPVRLPGEPGRVAPCFRCRTQ
mmetsp:Transcript_91678/g.213203  ORF Transcript_91678/g.213203 Transcript_91678/m.213203 type:complete len:251 (-) Transcript_91678:316-1068(-)